MILKKRLKKSKNKTVFLNLNTTTIAFHCILLKSHIYINKITTICREMIVISVHTILHLALSSNIIS